MPAKILLLDDDEELVAVLTTVLRSAGYDVVPRLERSVERVVEEAPDLVIVDAPPGHEGEILNFVQRVRLTPAVERVPVLLTATNLKYVEPTLLREQRIQVVIKPFDVKMLLGTIEKMI